MRLMVRRLHLLIAALAGICGCRAEKPTGGHDTLIRPSLVYDPVARRLVRFGGVRAGFPGSRYAGYVLRDSDGA